jgi:hypothetical protein
VLIRRDNPALRAPNCSCRLVHYQRRQPRRVQGRQTHSFLGEAPCPARGGAKHRIESAWPCDVPRPPRGHVMYPGYGRGVVTVDDGANMLQRYRGLKHGLLENDSGHCKVRVGKKAIWLASYTIVAVVSAGNGTRHRIGWSTCSPPNQTPPAPLVQGSTNQPSGLNTSSLTWVGRSSKSLMKNRKSRKAVRTSVPLPTLIHFGSHLRALLRGVKRERAAGTMFTACQSLPTKDWYRVTGMRLFFNTRSSSLRIRVALSLGRWMVRALPSNMYPRISLSADHWASPRSSFFIETGSLSPVWPETAGGGKKLWIPWSAALAILFDRD